ncbi:MAG: hypothetical protein J2P27_18495 [Actinobacteria bacterium]|nr:hypothetical protein [Actinomycetota bacterium]
MWLACALIILVTVGFVLPCMLDITMTPDSEFTTLTKGTWLMIAGAFWIFGATAWLVAGRPRRLRRTRRYSHYPTGRIGPAQALHRHPAARSASGYADPAGAIGFMTGRRPIGPDDDPQFLLELDRRIRDDREDGTPESALWGRARAPHPIPAYECRPLTHKLTPITLNSRQPNPIS